jgi:sensor domain CHASE-containing protein
MRLRTKTFIILSVTFICAFIIIAIFLSKLIMNGYFREESNIVSDRVHQSTSAIEITQNNLLNFVHDWSNWNETYQFAQDGNDEYIK